GPAHAVGRQGLCKAPRTSLQASPAIARRSPDTARCSWHRRSISIARENLSNQQILKPEPGVDSLQLEEAAQQETRADQEQERKRDFRGHQDAAHALAGTGCRAAPLVLLQ